MLIVYNKAMPPKITALAEHYAAAATAANTKLAYRKDLARFATWGGKIPTTPAILCDYLSQHAVTHKPSTLTRWLASISQAHLIQGLESPCRSIEVRRTLRGIKRAHGAKPRRVSPALRDEVLAMVRATPEGLAGLRNRALLLVGFAGALRRSELAKLRVEDISYDVRGMILALGKTKTDQSGEHDEIAIPFAKGSACPVKALKSWLAQANIKRGAIFRAISKGGKVGKRALNPHSIAQLIKALALAAGMDPTDYSGHSLRAGLATSSAKDGKAFHKIKAQTRHRSDVTLLKYIRDAELFEDNAADLL
jgi:integrase